APGLPPFTRRRHGLLATPASPENTESRTDGQSRASPVRAPLHTPRSPDPPHSGIPEQEDERTSVQAPRVRSPSRWHRVRQAPAGTAVVRVLPTPPGDLSQRAVRLRGRVQPPRA